MGVDQFFAKKYSSFYLLEFVLTKEQIHLQHPKLTETAQNYGTIT